MRNKAVRIWLLILLFGVCSPHRIKRTEIKRDNLIIDIEKYRCIKTLVSVEVVSDLDNTTTIDLSALGIAMIENGAFCELTAAKNLNLEYNKLKELDISLFSNFPNLEEISVAHNYITKFSGALIGSSNLKYLNLSNNNITNLRDSDLDDLPNSLEIIIGRSRLFNIAFKYDNVWDERNVKMHLVPWLRHVWIFEMYLRDAMTQRAQNPEPIFAKLCKTDDDTVESVKVVAEKLFGNCLSLNTSDNSSILSLAHLGLQKFQRGWYQIPDTFTVIDLSSNNISEITPELLNDLPNFITSVKLSITNVTTIKTNIIDNKFLEIFDMGDNSLGTIETGAFEKTNLHSIFLFNNKLTSMDFVRTLPTTLEYLILSYNRISEIPKDSLVNLKALKHLELQGNQLSHLPVGIFRGLKELQYLDINMNRLQKIEAGIFDDNGKLIVFAAGLNSIEELEDGVFKNTKSLRSIGLEDNRIKKISRNTFLGLRTGDLVYMNLGSNDIDTIEEGSFANMTIHGLVLTGNPLSEKSAAKGAFESSKLGILELPENFHINDMEYTSLVPHHDFYGLKIRYRGPHIYEIFEPYFESRVHFFVDIRD